MIWFLIGLVLFFGIHSVSIFAVPLRDRMAAKSDIGWKIFYSLVALIGIALMVKGYGALRGAPTFLYEPPLWLRPIAALLLLPVFILLLAPYFPGKIKNTLGHPQLVAVKLWSLAHLLVTGTLSSALLFGSFLVWAVADRISMKRRPKRPLPGMPDSKVNDVIVVVVGLTLYVTTVLWLHEFLLGVAPFG